MGVMGAGAYGMVLANMIRDKREQKKAEQAQQYQQVRQQYQIHVPDRFLYTSQIPQLPPNRPYSPRFGSDTEDEGTYNPFFAL